MKQIFKIFYITIIAFALVGCTHNIALNKKNTNLVLSNQKALVILGNKLKYPEESDYYSAVTGWSKDGVMNALGDKVDYLDNYKDHRVIGYAIEPGTYKLEEIYNVVTGGNTTTTRTTYIDNRMLSFSVKGGEFLYLGELLVNIDDQNIIKLYLKDRFDEVKAKALTDFPKLHNRLQKKLFF